jgi:hypothetical protein
MQFGINVNPVVRVMELVHVSVRPPHMRERIGSVSKESKCLPRAKPRDARRHTREQATETQPSARFDLLVEQHGLAGRQDVAMMAVLVATVVQHE